MANDRALQTAGSLPRSRFMALCSDALQGFKSETVRGAPGFFRVGQTHAGAWWLIGPDDRPFFAAAVNEVQALSAVPEDPVAPLRGWGFNTLGPGSAPALRDEGLPFVAVASFSGVVASIRSPGVRLPDVFDPAWDAAALRHAEDVCPALALRRELMGWLSDDGLSWGGIDRSDLPSLLQVCLSLEPSFAAYHAAWEFVLAPYGGQLTRLAKAWGCPWENKAVVRELTRAEQGLRTPGYVRDAARWTREFSRRYFAATSAAIRAHDPHHLIMGARELRNETELPHSHEWMTECVFPATDVAWVSARAIDSGHPGPLFAGNFTWVGENCRALPARSRARGVTSLERMLRQGRARLKATIAHPAVVGYAWDAWSDAPSDQPPFARGLVHLNGAEAREHTELLSDLNRRIPSLRPFPASKS